MTSSSIRQVYSEVALDPSLFLLPEEGEYLHVLEEKSSSQVTLLVLPQDNAKTLPAVIDAIFVAHKTLASQPIARREDVIKRFHLLSRIDALDNQAPIPLAALFPKKNSWLEIGRSTVIGGDYLCLPQKRREELLQFLGLDPTAPPSSTSSLELILAKKTDYLSLPPVAQVEALIELYEDNENEQVRDAAKNVFANYSTSQVIEAMGLNNFTEEKRKNSPPPPICTNVADWLLLLSKKHWEEVPKSVFFFLTSETFNKKPWVEKASISVQKFRDLYLKHDPEFAEFYPLAIKDNGTMLLPRLFPNKTAEDCAESEQMLTKVPSASLEPFFFDTNRPSFLSHLATLLSAEQIVRRCPSPESLWSCLSSFREAHPKGPLLCKALGETSWRKMLKNPQTDLLIALFAKGQLIGVAPIAPLVECLRRQKIEEIETLNSLAQACKAYLSSDKDDKDCLALSQFKAECEEKAVKHASSSHLDLTQSQDDQ